MPIRYKVVNVKDRSSCFCSGKKYGLIYTKGKRIKAKPGTVGIFVFRLRKQAEAFKLNRPNHLRWKVLRVKTVGKGITLKWRPLCYSESIIPRFKFYFERNREAIVCGKDVEELYDWNDHWMSLKNDGTMVYPAVIPLD